MTVTAKIVQSERNILVIGDSHANIFFSPFLADSLAGYKFCIASVSGATVSGLPNPNTVTNAMHIFRNALNTTTTTTVITLIGEVDTGFVIFYRAEKYNKSIKEMLHLAIANYKKLLLEINTIFRTICISAPLPTIVDGTEWGEVANARKSISASQLERTLVTREFNNEIQKFCLSEGIDNINLDEESLDKNGLVKKKLLNRDIMNHHYDHEEYSKILVPHLKPLLDPHGPNDQYLKYPLHGHHVGH